MDGPVEDDFLYDSLDLRLDCMAAIAMRSTVLFPAEHWYSKLRILAREGSTLVRRKGCAVAAVYIVAWGLLSLCFPTTSLQQKQLRRGRHLHLQHETTPRSFPCGFNSEGCFHGTRLSFRRSIGLLLRRPPTQTNLARPSRGQWSTSSQASRNLLPSWHAPYHLAHSEHRLQLPASASHRRAQALSNCLL